MKEEEEMKGKVKAEPDDHEIELMMKCAPYFIRYPDEDEEGFDGIHYGGIKGLREDAPEEVKRAYEELIAIWEEYERLGIKV